jgi:phospholipid N-methyltransferase
MSDFVYIGDELEIFHHATTWKKYYGQHLSPFLGKEVLEVGAGIGGTTKSLCSDKQTRWVCLEPDSDLAVKITESIKSKELPTTCEVKTSSLAELSEEEKFDSIIYIDVLEHIENDKNELEIAAKHLKRNGFIIVLSPAHQFLYTPFDKAIGHFRRYNKKELRELTPNDLKLVKLIYLDSVGGLASLGNKLILKSSSPSHQQIQFWDKRLVPLSKLFDRIFGFTVGKSILAVWQRQD